MQVGILGESVVLGSHFAKDGRNLRIHAALIIGHTQHVEGISSMSGRFGIVLQVLLEGLYGFVIFPEMVFGCTEDAVQLRRVRVAQTVGVGRQSILRYNFRLVVLFLQQVDFGDVIGNQVLVFGIVLQRQETAERFVIPSLGISDIRDVVSTVRCIFPAGAAQGLEPDGCFLYIARLQIAGGKAVGHVVTLLGTQKVEAGRVEHGEGIVIIAFEEIGGGD